jgi:ELWxxDGT repeat protein
MKPKSLALLIFSSLAPTLFGELTGPELVKDIYPGARGSIDYETTFEAVGNTLFLAADDSTRGKELWKSDGTREGTMLVKDLCTGNHGSNPSRLIKAGNFVFFMGHDRTHSRALWRSDGTTAGTLMLKDILQGRDSSSYALPLGSVGDVLYFTITDERHGIGELWKSDGTVAGTAKVITISPTSRVAIYPGVAMGGIYYFRVSRGSRTELWRTDGSTNGTRYVTNTDSEPAAAGDHLYFTYNDGIHGRELWTSDGSTAGSRMVKEIAPGSSSGVPYGPFAAGGLAYFSAKVSDESAWSLWRSDGTEAGTFPLLELAEQYWNSIHVAGNHFYFTPKLPNGNSEVWKSDGTVAGTKPLKAGTPGGRMIYFGSGSGSFYFLPVFGGPLWQSDGTTRGTRMVGDFSMTGIGHPGSGVYPTAVNGKLLFAASNSTSDKELYSYDIRLPSIAKPQLSEITTGSVRLDLAVNPNGISSSAKLEYGTSDAYGSIRYLPVAGESLLSSFQDFPVLLSGLAAGTTYHYRVSATNERGTRVSTGSFRTAFTRDTWRSAVFGAEASSQISADDQDPDGDGISNLIEYAFGLDPNKADSAGLPKPLTSGQEMVFEFTRPEGQEDMIYGVEWSPNMAPGSWASVPDTGSGFHHRFVVDTRQKPRVFTRWKVTPR